MKTLIFLIFVVLVISGIVWQMRKSQAKEDLAKRKATELLRQRQKEAVTPQEDVIWPVVIRPVKGQGSASGSNPGHHEKDNQKYIRHRGVKITCELPAHHVYRTVHADASVFVML